MGQEIKIWGQVKNSDNQLVIYTKIALLKKYYLNRRKVFKVVDWTYTNSEGYYRFFVKANQQSDYRIVVYNKGEEDCEK